MKTTRDGKTIEFVAMFCMISDWTDPLPEAIRRGAVAALQSLVDSAGPDSSNTLRVRVCATLTPGWVGIPTTWDCIYAAPDVVDALSESNPGRVWTSYELN